VGTSKYPSESSHDQAQVAWPFPPAHIGSQQRRSVEAQPGSVTGLLLIVQPANAADRQTELPAREENLVGLRCAFGAGETKIPVEAGQGTTLRPPLEDAVSRLIDLHAHLPMHMPYLSGLAHPATSDLPRALLLRLANMSFNSHRGRPRVTLPLAIEGNVGGFGSVLYNPGDEFLRPVAPRPEAFNNTMAQMRQVERALAADASFVLARNPEQLERAHADSDKVGVFHCVEGAQAVGGDAANVRRLAESGVAYMTVAHLFFRGAATCSNALPKFPDSIFNWLNPQPDAVGLTPLGRDIVEALLESGIIVDVTHASEHAQRDIFDVAAHYPDRPIISSHNSVRRIADYGLNLSDDTVRRIVESGGVVGIIMFGHWLLPKGSDQKAGLSDVCRVVDALHDVTGSYDAIAIGTDLDGFITPVEGFASFASADAFANALADRFGSEVSDRLLFGNALRVLRDGWRGVAGA
jgi:microsomal dipeptidase-like Zn-dependent dipeptidase